MKVRLVTTLREFDGLGPAWSDLTRQAAQPSPFLSHDWFACCWRTAGPDRQREAWVLEEAGGPVAFLPLVRSRGRRYGLPVRVLGFLESPDTPYIDIPHAGSTERIVSAFVEALGRRGDWDVLSLPKLQAESATVKALQSLLSGKLPWRIAGEEESPYVAISGTWAEYLRRRTPRFRKTCRNIENRLRRKGTVTIEEHREVSPDGLLFAELMEVSRQSWKGPRGLGMATMLGMPRFFRELTRRASARGWLQVWILRVDGRAVASEYQIASNGSVHALRADFDAALEDLSPGAALNQRIIQALFDRPGAREYDMGPGRNPYKLRWATGSHRSVWLQAYAPTPYGRFLHSVETRLIPLVRQWRDRVRRPCA